MRTQHKQKIKAGRCHNCNWYMWSAHQRQPAQLPTHSSTSEYGYPTEAQCSPSLCHVTLPHVAEKSLTLTGQ